MKPYTEEMLLVTISQLESKPIDVQLILAQTYINCWHSDHGNLKQALEQALYVDEKAAKEPEPEKEEISNHRKHEMERTR